MSEPAKNRRSRQKRMFGRLKNELDAMRAEVECQRWVNAAVAQENMDLRAKLSTAKEEAFREALDAWATELNRKCGWAESRVAYSCWLESQAKGGAL